jgi:hypothetical protein
VRPTLSVVRDSAALKLVEGMTSPQDRALASVAANLPRYETVATLKPPTWTLHGTYGVQAIDYSRDVAIIYRPDAGDGDAFTGLAWCDDETDLAGSKTPIVTPTAGEAILAFRSVPRPGTTDAWLLWRGNFAYANDGVGDDGINCRVYRSLDMGLTWTLVLASTCNGPPNPNAVDVDATGRVVFGSYAINLATTDAREIQLSEDGGATWTQVYTWTNIVAPRRHFHCARFDQVSADRLWITMGDGVGGQLLRLDRAAGIWTATSIWDCQATAANTPDDQPDGLDRLPSGELLVAGKEIKAYNPATNTWRLVHALPTPSSTESGLFPYNFNARQPYIRYTFFHDGILYAPSSQYSTPTGIVNAGLWASADEGRHWVCVYRDVDMGVQGIAPNGYWRGLIWCLRSNPAAPGQFYCYSFTPVHVSQVEALRLEAGCANLATLETSTLKTAAGAASAGSFSRRAPTLDSIAAVDVSCVQTDGGFFGTNYIRITRRTNGTGSSGRVDFNVGTTGTIVIPPGRRLTVLLRVRTNGQPRNCTSMLNLYDYTAGDLLRSPTGAQWRYSSDGEWDLYTIVITNTTGANRNVEYGELNFVCQTTPWSTAAEIIWTWDIDCLMSVLSDVRHFSGTSFVPGGSTRADEYATADVSILPAGGWTILFDWRPESGCAEYGDTALPLASLLDATGGHLDLDWLSATRKIHVTDGTDQVSAAATTAFRHFDLVRLALVSDGTDTRLYTWDAVNGYSTAAVGTGVACGRPAALRLSTNHDLSVFGAGHYGNVQAWPKALSAAQVHKLLGGHSLGNGGIIGGGIGGIIG